MQPHTTKKLVGILFVLFMWIPFACVFASGKLVAALRATATNPQEWVRQKEVLRRSTPLWNRSVEAYTRTMYSLGTTSNQGVAVIGRHGFVFLGDNFNRNISQASGRRIYNARETSEWLEVLRAQNSWLKHQDIDLLFVVAPAKWSIYPEKLPRWIDRRATHTLDKLVAQSGGLPLLDVRDGLKAARSEADTYSPMNSHWTDFGAYVAWKQIAATLGAQNPAYRGLYVPPYAGVTVADDNNEFAGMIGLTRSNPWTMPVYRSALPAYEVIDENSGGSVVFGGAAKTDLLYLPRHTRSAYASNKARVLVMRDSTGNSLSPFLQAAFSETIQVDHHLNTPESATDLVPLVQKYHPDLVIYIVTERYLDGPLGSADRWRRLAAADVSSVKDNEGKSSSNP